MINKLIAKVTKRVQNYKDRFDNRIFLDRRQIHSLWEAVHLEKLLPYLEVDCIFDIGANCGQYGQMLRKKAKYNGYIFSFEPSPIVAQALRECADGDPKWIIEEIAISDTDGVTQFNLMNNSEFSSLSVPRHADVQLFREMNKVVKTIVVKTERLESVLRRLQDQYQFKRPFLKMDTQGFDVRIVTSSPKAVRNFVGLQSELAIAKLYESSTDFREALSVYENHGFSLSAFVPNNAGHFPRLLEVDCIMIRSDLGVV